MACSGRPVSLVFQPVLLDLREQRLSAHLQDLSGAGLVARCRVSDKSLSSAFVTQHLLILIMRSDPDPYEVITVLNGQRPVIDTDPRGPERADFLEMERRMGGV